MKTIKHFLQFCANRKSRKTRLKAVELAIKTEAPYSCVIGLASEIEEFITKGLQS